ncbi:MAG: GtrA family protein [Patescibacteria group bacterium]|jgi:putative flippase GtrA
MNKIAAFIQQEWKMIFRFLLVGSSSFLVKAGVYALLSRLLWMDGPRSLQNAAALSISMMYNYTLHRLWTFTHQAPSRGSAQRYVGVVAVASLLDVVFFYFAHDVFGLYDFLVLVLGAMLGAFFTFTAHRLFTFHNNPYKRKADVVQSP